MYNSIANSTQPANSIYPPLVVGQTDYTATAFSALRRIPPALRSALQRSQRWEDVVAWAFVAAWEGFKENWTRKEVYNAAQRYIYHALKAMGYRRVQNRYEVTEIAYSADEMLKLFGEINEKEAV